MGYRLSQGEKGHQRAREPIVASGRLSLGVSERIIGISIISYGKNSLDLRPTWVTTSPRERIEFVSQGPAVLLTKIVFIICHTTVSLCFFTLFSCLERYHHDAGTHLRWQRWREICSLAKHSIKNLCRAGVDVKPHTRNLASTMIAVTNFYRSEN